jgi:hypothetical protein
MFLSVWFKKNNIGNTIKLINFVFRSISSEEDRGNYSGKIIRVLYPPLGPLIESIQATLSRHLRLFARDEKK